MPAWFWLNVPAMVLFFALWVGIPMWMVLRKPDQDPVPDRSAGSRRAAEDARRARDEHGPGQHDATGRGGRALEAVGGRRSH